MPLLTKPIVDGIYLGIDPGENGGMALRKPGETLETRKLSNMTEAEIWHWIHDCGARFAVIEQQIPRPTNLFDPKTKQFRSTILKSTCLLFGSYRQLRGMLSAAGIPFEDCPPKRWQQALHIPPREKSEKDADWKRRLKERAERLFPRDRITLAVADSILIAEYCRNSQRGK